MSKTVHLTRTLKASVSSAALCAAAVSVSGDARAQTCTLGNTLQGVAQGTAVTCPSGQQFNNNNQVAIPDGSTITNVVNGNNPEHQGWTFVLPGGATQNLFINGRYNLRDGIGGTTVLDGFALNTLSGAGSCGVGGYECGGSYYDGLVPNAYDLENSTSGGGGGAYGGYVYPDRSNPNVSSIYAPIFGDGGGGVYGGGYYFDDFDTNSFFEGTQWYSGSGIDPETGLPVYDSGNVGDGCGSASGWSCSQGSSLYGTGDFHSTETPWFLNDGREVVTITGHSFNEWAGNDAADTLFGTADNSGIDPNGEFDGLGSNDEADTLFGNDESDIGGNDEADTFFGNDEADTLFGNSETDFSGGNDGTDIMFGNDASDTMWGQADVYDDPALANDGGVTFQSFGFGPQIVLDGFTSGNLNACSQNSDSCAVVLGQGGGAIVLDVARYFNYGPSISGVEATGTSSGSDEFTITGQGFSDTAFGETSLAPSAVFDIPGGDIVIDTQVEGSGTPGITISNFLTQHKAGSQAIESFYNDSTGGGGGAVSTYSMPSFDGSSVFTSDTKNWAISTFDGRDKYTVSITWGDENRLVNEVFQTTVTPGSDIDGPSLVSIGSETITGTGSQESVLDDLEQFSEQSPNFSTTLVNTLAERAGVGGGTEGVATASAVPQIMNILSDNPVQTASRTEDVMTGGVPVPSFESLGSSSLVGTGDTTLSATDELQIQEIGNADFSSDDPLKDDPARISVSVSNDPSTRNSLWTDIGSTSTGFVVTVPELPDVPVE